MSRTKLGQTRSHQQEAVPEICRSRTFALSHSAPPENKFRGKMSGLRLKCAGFHVTCYLPMRALGHKPRLLFLP